MSVAVAGLLRSALTVETLASVVARYTAALLEPAPHCQWSRVHTIHRAHTETGSDARVCGAATEENYSVQEMIITV